MKKLSTFFIIAGILIALSPIAGNLYTSYMEHKMIQEWLDSVDTNVINDSTSNPNDAFDKLQQAFDAENNDTQQAASTQSEVTPQPNTSAGSKDDNSKKIKTKQVLLGVIIIDKIKVKAPIVEGIAKENLSSGVGHIPGTAGIGQSGNCAIAGHRSYTFGKYFNRLDEVKIGDEIVIMTKNKNYKYKVYEKLVVLPKDVWVITGAKKESILTLVTCTPIYIATHRLIIHARLEE